MIEKKTKHIAIIGSKGTGKTETQKMLTEQYDMNVAISDTTRDIRRGEVDGVDYNFITDEEFESKLNKGEYVEHVEARGCKYGISRDEIGDSDTVFVVDTEGLVQLFDSGLNLMVVKLNCKWYTRLMRILKRDGFPSNPIKFIKKFIDDTMEFDAILNDGLIVDYHFNTNEWAKESIVKEIYYKHFKDTLIE